MKRLAPILLIVPASLLSCVRSPVSSPTELREAPTLPEQRPWILMERTVAGRPVLGFARPGPDPAVVEIEVRNTAAVREIVEAEVVVSGDPSCRYTVKLESDDPDLELMTPSTFRAAGEARTVVRFTRRRSGTARLTARIVEDP